MNKGLSQTFKRHGLGFSLGVVAHKGRKMSAGEIADCTCWLASLLACLLAGLLATLTEIF